MRGGCLAGGTMDGGVACDVFRGVFLGIAGD